MRLATMSKYPAGTSIETLTTLLNHRLIKSKRVHEQFKDLHWFPKFV